MDRPQNTTEREKEKNGDETVHTYTQNPPAVTNTTQECPTLIHNMTQRALVRSQEVSKASQRYDKDDDNGTTRY